MDSISLSLISTGISLVSMLLHFHNYRKARFNVKVSFDDSDSFYFDALDTLYGNQESLVASVTIFNDSSVPISISDIRICFPGKLSFPAAHGFSYPYPEHWADETYSAVKDENGNVLLKSVDSDGWHSLDLQNQLITAPLKLSPYDCVKGFLLFPVAGSSVDRLQKTKIQFVTPRKTKTYTHSFISKSAHESSFR